MGQQNQTSFLAVAEGGTIIHNVATIVLSGSGVSLQVDPRNPRNVDVTITGGGGGSAIAPGLGAYTVSGGGTVTIGNTGTIVQPTITSGPRALGINLFGGVCAPTTASAAYGGAAYHYGGSAYGQAVGHYVQAGEANFGGGNAFIGATAVGIGAAAIVAGGLINPAGVVYGGGVQFACGDVNQGTGTAGAVTLAAGHGRSINADGGSLVLTVGTGNAGNGVLLVNNIGTVDPHVLNAKWMSSITGTGFVGVYSQG